MCSTYFVLLHGAGLAVIPLHLARAALLVHILLVTILLPAAGGSTSLSFHWLSRRPKVQYSSKGVTYSCSLPDLPSPSRKSSGHGR